MAQTTNRPNITFDRNVTISMRFPRLSSNGYPSYPLEEATAWISEHKPAIRLIGELNVEEVPDSGYYNDMAQTWEAEYFGVPDTHTYVKYADVATLLAVVIPNEDAGLSVLLAGIGMMGGHIERYSIDWSKDSEGYMVAHITFREIACKGN
jgi:hypothetical protein